MRAIREEHAETAIVVAAAKAFIPFLLGSPEADIAVYPTTVYPVRVRTGEFRLVVRAQAGTERGLDGIHREKNWLVAEFTKVAVTSAPGSVLRPFWDGDILELHWTMPAGWGTSERALLLQHWLPLMKKLAVQMDRAYHEVARHLLDAIDPMRRGVLLQSWFSTDSYAHWEGPGSANYDKALDAAFMAIDSMAKDGFVVGMTSDHGGRVTPVILDADEGAQVALDQNGQPIDMPTPASWLLSGDHIVGYSSAITPCAAWTWNGTVASPVKAPPQLWADSFSKAQEPAWLLLPGRDEAFGDTGGGGGDHGASEEGGQISDVDDYVPVCGIGMHASGALPKRLHEVKKWFLTLA